MRAKNLLGEKMNKDHNAAIPGMVELGVDQYYDTYKWSKDVAGHDGKKQTAPKGDTGAFKDAPVTGGLSKTERNMAKKAANGNVTQITSDGSKEHKDTQTASPISGNVKEARMSAAVKLQRAWDREQAKSTASRKRGEEVMAQAKADAEKKDKEQPVKEARKANSASARREFGKRTKKPTLTPQEQDKQQQHQDELWAQLMAHIEAEKKKQGVTEGGFKNLYAEFSGYGNYMQGRAVNVFKKAGLDIVSKEYTEDDDIQTYVVKGDRWAIEKAGQFLERNPEQFGGYHFVKQGVSEDTIHVGYRNSSGDWIKTTTHDNYRDAKAAMERLVKAGKKGVQHRYDNKGNIDPGAMMTASPDSGVAEGSTERKQNALWAQITDYEKRAKATSNDIKKAHYLKMADDLRSKLKTSDLNEFAPMDGGDDGDGDPEEMLHRLASVWWNGTEKEMIKAERTLASMGWEIGEDEGYDDGGVFVVRAGDDNGKSYISWSHEDLQGLEETKVSKYKDLGATKDTTHFIKNVTTGKIVSPHRGKADAEDALVALYRGPSDGNEYKIVRARKESVNEMDKSSPQPGRDGHVSHSTYGSRDKHSVSDGPDLYGKIAKPGDVVKQGTDALNHAFMSALKGLKTWQVVIMNNYYRGKYSDYSGRHYYVLASSADEAKQVVIDNADAILKDLLAMKSHNGKKILPRGSAVRITPERINGVKDGTEHGRMSTAGYKKMYSPQGPMMVKLANGEVVDVKDNDLEEASLSTARVSPQTLQVLQQLRKQLSVHSTLQAKKTMLVMKSDYLDTADRQLVVSTLKKAGIPFKIKDNDIEAVRGSWTNTLVGIPYDQPVAEAQSTEASVKFVGGELDESSESDRIQSLYDRLERMEERLGYDDPRVKALRDEIRGLKDEYRVVGKHGFAEESDRQFAQRMKKKAAQPPTKGMSQKEKEDKGWRNPNIESEQIYNILALDKGNALKKPTKLKWKASSLEDIFDALAAQDWYPLEINGVEVIAGKRLKQGVAEGIDSELEQLTGNYRALMLGGGLDAEGKRKVTMVYNLLRDPIMKGDRAEYEKMHDYVGGKYTDIFDLLVGADDYVKNVNEGRVSEADAILRQIAEDEDWDLLYKIHGMAGKPTPEGLAGNIIDDMYQDVAIESGHHADDDFEEIYNTVLDRIIEQYGIEESVQVNEVDPRNFDSDVDYYNALNRPHRSASIDDFDDKPEPYDPYAEFERRQEQKRRAAEKTEPKMEYHKEEGRAPNGQRYNMTVTFTSPDKHRADYAATRWVDSEWGAKKLIDKEQHEHNGETVVTIYIQDNHKHGMWKPWKDEEPISKGVSFEAATNEDLGYKFKTSPKMMPRDTLGTDMSYHWGHGGGNKYGIDSKLGPREDPRFGKRNDGKQGYRPEYQKPSEYGHGVDKPAHLTHPHELNKLLAKHGQLSSKLKRLERTNITSSNDLAIKHLQQEIDSIEHSINDIGGTEFLKHYTESLRQHAELTKLEESFVNKYANKYKGK